MEEQLNYDDNLDRILLQYDDDMSKLQLNETHLFNILSDTPNKQCYENKTFAILSTIVDYLRLHSTQQKLPEKLRKTHALSPQAIKTWTQQVTTIQEIKDRIARTPCEDYQFRRILLILSQGISQYIYQTNPTHWNSLPTE